MRWSAVILFCLLVGCSRSPARRPPIDKVDVVATVYPLAMLADAVGGPVADVHWLVESGQSLRGAGEDARDRVGSARVILINSSVTEPWVPADAGMSLGGQRVLRLDAFASARDASPGGWLWLDPLVVREAAIELHNRLLALRARQASILTDRTDAFVAEIDGLIQSYGPKFAPLVGRKVLTLGRTFVPLLARQKLLAQTAADKQPTDLDDDDMNYLQSLAKDGTPLLLDEQTPAATQRLITGRGIRIIAIDSLGSSAPSGRNDYLALMRFNYDALLEGLKTASTR